MRSTLGLASALSVAVLVAGCSSSRTDWGATPNGTVNVFAASSLKKTFTELGARFEKDHPGTEVTFNFAGSADLVAQLSQGAPADVFASADTRNMTKAVDGGLVAGQPADFASNTLTIVTPPGNPRGITSFGDLTRPGTQVVVCAPQVPCGSAAERVEEAAGATLTPVSEESAVADVLGKVTSGQADAGLVYVTDAVAAGDRVTEIAFPESGVAANTYPIAALAGSRNPDAAQQFMALVTGPQGREVLSAAGFGPP
ncbi:MULTISPECIES: molybdate ABC transporter substrate-binding protein [Mycolicibacterium]|jgi:molybdate transport system substrate-binding protein|uniref:molybdate ABC transporter substrate-binding protein n=1 Tax=Mycolicibacterium TaxID=1866885 RepID=UPI0005613F10|nr:MULTISPECIES: molybdate ABC transporter substrate-binding protein [Mycolicibacterium]MDW5613718.1 molybdate ABC transporter substrate-binding protein [Mycolicibacterium sp. D5.8-2]QZY48533.1 molybdate ABC transporter substrate-binding protein [Mycolicibacterium austroafricanum]